MYDTLTLLYNCKHSNSEELMFCLTSHKEFPFVVFPSCVYFHIPSNLKNNFVRKKNILYPCAQFTG